MGREVRGLERRRDDDGRQADGYDDLDPGDRFVDPREQPDAEDVDDHEYDQKRDRDQMAGERQVVR